MRSESVIDAFGILRRAVGLALIVGCAHGMAASPSIVTLTPEVLPLPALGSGVLTATLGVPALQPTVVTLGAEPPGALTLPAEVVIPAGATTAVVSVTALVPQGTASVTATLGASTSSADVIIGNPVPACEDAAGLAGSAASAYSSQPAKVATACTERGAACNDAIAAANEALKAIAQAHRLMKATCRPVRP
jgi:hypothetical protein